MKRFTIALALTALVAVTAFAGEYDARTARTEADEQLQKANETSHATGSLRYMALQSSGRANQAKSVCAVFPSLQENLDYMYGDVLYLEALDKMADAETEWVTGLAHYRGALKLYQDALTAFNNRDFAAAASNWTHSMFNFVECSDLLSVAWYQFAIAKTKYDQAEQRFADAMLSLQMGM